MSESPSCVGIEHLMYFTGVELSSYLPLDRFAGP